VPWGKGKGGVIGKGKENRRLKFCSFFSTKEEEPCHKDSREGIINHPKKGLPTREKRPSPSGEYRKSNR